MAQAAASVLGPGAVTGTTQSLGGEDFAWYLESVPGAMARLGTRSPDGPTYDLHQGNLRIDDRAVVVGARTLAAAATRALRTVAAGTGEPTDSITN
jgi:metal-dependent amidase/aminoacylase/carboxypeptidase family protein